jgi:putative transposase
MSYLYRKLTPKQKREIILFRRERDYPEHSPPHPFRDAGIYLISASCYNHMPVLESPFRRTEFEIMLFQEMSRTNSKIIGWTILSNHYHFLVDVDSLDYISETLRNLHGSTSRKWNLEDGTVGRRQVWYKFSDRLIRNETHMLCALNYIHFNR